MKFLRFIFAAALTVGLTPGADAISLWSSPKPAHHTRHHKKKRKAAPRKMMAAAVQTSTVNPNIPAQNSQLSSAPIRSNFQAAANDINTLFAALAAAQLPTAGPGINITAGVISLAAPTASTLGGVRSFAAVPHQWINSLSTSGGFSTAQPTFADISGTATAAQLPLFSATAAGTVPASGGGTVDFLRADNVWAAPPGGGTGTVTTSGTPSSGQIALFTGSTVITGVTPTGTGAVVLAASPTLTGVPIAPTATAGTNTTQVATTQFVTTAVAAGGTVHGPLSSTVGHVALYGNTTGTTLTDAAPSALPVTSTSTSTARALGDRFADFGNVRDYGADPTGATDSTTAFKNAISAHSRVYVPAGTYKLTSALNLTNKILYGDGAHNSNLVSFDPTAADPVLFVGGNAIVHDLALGFDGSMITGTESDGDRVGINVFDPASNLQLQRGATISNLYINHVGTGIYDPPTPNTTTVSSAAFSATFQDLEIQTYTYRGFDFVAPNRTGNVYRNIYINNASELTDTRYLHVDTGFNLRGSESELTLEQLNVEWATGATAINFTGVQALKATSIHLEEFTIPAGDDFSPLIVWNQSSGSIDSLTVYFTPIKIAGWFVVQIQDATNVEGGTNPQTANYLHIGTLNLLGLNDGPQVTSGNGITSASNLAFFDRETAAVGTFFLQVDSFTWNTFQTDTAVYMAFPTDPHALITKVTTGSGPMAAINGTVGVTCAAVPTSSFHVTNGIVTHC